MQCPIRFIHGNLVFGHGPGEVWGIYRVGMRSYPGLATRDKIGVLSDLASMLYHLERDCQILRVSRPWSTSEYLRQAWDGRDARTSHDQALSTYLQTHESVLDGSHINRPEAYVAVRLGERPNVTNRAKNLTDRGRGGLRTRIKDTFGLNDPGAIRERDLDELLRQEHEMLARIGDFAAASRASTSELTWLIRRAYARGVETDVHTDGYTPQAIIVEDPSGEAVMRPLEHDLLRLFDTPITIGTRTLRMDLEVGESHQAILMLGATPEQTPFPGAGAELLFAPLEAVEFPVDAALSARFVGNREALTLVRRRRVDAENNLNEQAMGDHSPSNQALSRPQAAAELTEYLEEGRRPPLFETTVTLAVGAPTAEELERRVEILRREYGQVTLHRPVGEQLRGWCAHLPGNPNPPRGYSDYMLIEQIGAMVPFATHEVGARSGFYLGYTIPGAPTPVLFDLTEASRGSRPPTVLVLGTLGSGKTMLLQNLLYQGYMSGSRIFDLDPKGDHGLERLIPAEDIEVVELGGRGEYRGMLDPLVIAPRDVAADVAYTWLVDVLPQPVVPAWQTEIRRALTETVASDPQPTCRSVITRLIESANPVAVEAGRALDVFAAAGFAQLGFADADSIPTDRLSKQVVSLRIRNLPRPVPGTPRAEMTEEERIGQGVLRLIAVWAMHVMGADRTRHKILGFDEAFFLLGDAVGRRLMEQMNRWGRSEFATPILVTHMTSDAAELDNLIGARFVMGMEAESEAKGALELLHLDGDDPALVQRLLRYRKGACMLRDFEGRVGNMQVHVSDPAILAALDTTPSHTMQTDVTEVVAA